MNGTARYATVSAGHAVIGARELTIPIVMCPNQEDDHAPFPHLLVTPANRSAKSRAANPDDPVFIICTHCGHWIERVMARCHCREHCHILAALDRDLFVTKKS